MNPQQLIEYLQSRYPNEWMEMLERFKFKLREKLNESI